MKLNLGCGYDRRDGWLNVDRFEACGPDRVLDLEVTPWDLPTNGFDHVLMRHVLEHLGASFEVFAAILRELYRVTAPGGLLEIHVPHLRHDSQWTDPTHVRTFTAQTFQMLSKRQNHAWIEARANITMLALMIDVDFELENVALIYDPTWAQRIRAGEITHDEAFQLARERWNVAQELHVRLRAVKA